MAMHRAGLGRTGPIDVTAHRMVLDDYVCLNRNEWMRTGYDSSCNWFDHHHRDVHTHIIRQSRRRAPTIRLLSLKYVRVFRRFKVIDLRQHARSSQNWNAAAFPSKTWTIKISSFHHPTRWWAKMCARLCLRLCLCVHYWKCFNLHNGSTLRWGVCVCVFVSLGSVVYFRSCTVMKWNRRKKTNHSWMTLAQRNEWNFYRSFGKTIQCKPSRTHIQRCYRYVFGAARWAPHQRMCKTIEIEWRCECPIYLLLLLDCVTIDWMWRIFLVLEIHLQSRWCDSHDSDGVVTWFRVDYTDKRDTRINKGRATCRRNTCIK